MRITAEEMRVKLRDDGVVLLRDFFGSRALARLREAASRCFDAIKAGTKVPEHYRFSPHAHSVLLSALLDFGCGSEKELMAPLSQPGLAEMFSEVMGGAWRCSLEQSWARKKFAPRSAPKAGFNRQGWHQDGALGVQFPPQPGSFITMTELLTCWIPLQACGRDSPGLEFIRNRQPALLHFTELGDAA